MSFLDTSLDNLSINVCSSAKEGELAVYGNAEAYTTVIYLTQFYLSELVSKNYIRYYQTACESTTEINLGKPSIGEGPGFLPQDISSEIEQRLSQNLVVSPEFKEYIEAGHQSLELSEAKKTSRISVIALIFAGISSCAAIISLICNLV